MKTKFQTFWLGRRETCLLNFFPRSIIHAINLISNVSSFPGGSEVKTSACNVGDLGSIPGSGRSPREGNGNPLQYFCLENSMDGGWWATVLGVAKSQTRLSNFTFFHFQYFKISISLQNFGQMQNIAAIPEV